MRILEDQTRFQVKIFGADHLDLLHRITSNHIKDLAVGQSNYQCLLNPKGKIIVPFELTRHEDHCILIGPIELEKRLIETIDQYIFAEDVKLEVLDPVVTDPADEDERIRLGLLRWGVDVDENTIPWAAEMGDYVSTDKGCYTGQEVIARIETYGRTPERIVRLETEAPDRPTVGELKLVAENVGRITSMVSAPDSSGKWHALGYVKKKIDVGMEIEGDDKTTWAVLDSNQ